MNEQTAVQASSQLQKILSDSKLELTEAELIKQSYLPYFNTIAVIKQEAKKINFDSPSPLDEKIARDLRLRTVKVRTGSEQVKEERKRIHMLKANVEQSAWNLIKTTCQLDEETFLQVEKKREIAEAKRKAEAKIQRENEINADGLSEFVPLGIDLGLLTEEDFGKLKDGARLQLQARKEAAVKAELERIAKAKAAADERERIQKENAVLKKEAEERERQIKIESDKRAKLEADRIKKEAAERKVREEKEQKERQEFVAKLKVERMAKEKSERELRAKREAEEKTEAERQAQIESELAKGDKEKFADFISDLQAITTKYAFKSKKYKASYNVGVELINKTINHLK